LKESSNEILSKETEITTLNAKLNEFSYKIVMGDQNHESIKEMLDSKTKNEDSLNSVIQKLNQDLSTAQDTILKQNKE